MYKLMTDMFFIQALRMYGHYRTCRRKLMFCTYIDMCAYKFRLKITYLCPRSFMGNRTFTCSKTGPLCFSISCRTAMAINPIALKAEDRSFSWKWHRRFVFTQVIITNVKHTAFYMNVFTKCVSHSIKTSYPSECNTKIVHGFL